MKTTYGSGEGARGTGRRRVQFGWKCVVADTLGRNIHHTHPVEAGGSCGEGGLQVFRLVQGLGWSGDSHARILNQARLKERPRLKDKTEHSKRGFHATTNHFLSKAAVNVGNGDDVRSGSAR